MRTQSQSQGIADSWKRNPATFFFINQAIRPSWTVPSKIQKSSMVKDSNTTPIPSCDQNVHFLDLSPKMGCDFVVVFADWDEFSHSLHLTFYTNDF